MNRFILCLALLLSPVAIAGALEVPVPVIEERNLSFDIGSDFEVTTDLNPFSSLTYELDFGEVRLNPTIILTHPDTDDTATIHFYSFYYIKPNIFKLSSPSTIAEILLVMFLTVYDDEITDYWTTRTSTGENVTVCTISMTEDGGQSENMYLSSLYLGEGNNYAILFSTFDRATTQKIIETLTLEG